MSKIVNAILDFDAPAVGAADIVSYRVRYFPVGGEFTYEHGSLDFNAVEGTNSVDLAQVVESNGEWDVYITSVKASGNESDPVKITVNVDLDAPNPPVNLRVR